MALELYSDAMPDTLRIAFRVRIGGGNGKCGDLIQSRLGNVDQIKCRARCLVPAFDGLG